MRTTSLLLALSLTLTACGNPTDPAELNSQGAKALGSGNYAEAAQRFEQSLTAIGGNKADSQFLRAKWGLIESGAQVAPGLATEDFLSFAQSNPETIRAAEFAKVSSWLSAARHFPQAVQVLDAGITRFPESGELQDLKRGFIRSANQPDNDNLKGALANIGYLSDE